MLSAVFGFLSKHDPAKDLDGLKKILDLLQNDDLSVNQKLLESLVTIIKVHYKHRKIVLIGCHIMSNIALNENHAVSMIHLNAARVLCKVLKRHDKDSRVVWKAASALWNLCRPVNIATHIPKNTVELVFKCLLQNEKSSRATHTALGALSNLALVCPESFKKCMTVSNLQSLREVVIRYHSVSEICGHFGALVANMSVCTELAECCVTLDYVDILIKCLEDGHLKGTEAVKHVVAALHNLSDINDFTAKLCLSHGIEVLRRTQAEHADGEIFDFVDGIFDLGALPNTALTSLHVAAVCCDIRVVVSILHDCDADIIDKEGKTACDLAIEQVLGDITELLIAAGTKFSFQSFLNLPASDRRHMKRYLRRGKSHCFRSHQKMQSLITQKTNLVKDVAHVVTECIPGIELLTVLQ